MLTGIFAIIEPLTTTSKSALVYKNMTHLGRSLFFVTNHLGNPIAPNAHAVIVKRNQIKARSTA